MRIVAGKYGSRILVSVDGQETRPTSDKVKGAVFSSLGNLFDGGKMLDCYSGTGNMALEAISRGMDQALCIDFNKKAIRVIETNINNLGLQDQVKAIQGNVFSILPRLEEKFDLVYIDPPYKKEENEKLLKILDEQDLVQDHGVVVIESMASQSFSKKIGRLVQYKEKTYRNTKITYYRKEEEYD